ncbi:S-layer homology domain-containing protein [Paenibacillaceae bacterium WGS1546]|uniref:S-layer homology domain-containing protein n=1 Tax=Cohnella sp. WGS1546 TaxID=3366810 RepID=UPI00372D2FCC
MKQGLKMLLVCLMAAAILVPAPVRVWAAPDPQGPGDAMEEVTIDVRAGLLIGTNSSMEYSTDSTDGTNGVWQAATDHTTAVSFAQGQVFVRETSNPSNYRLVATIDAPDESPRQVSIGGNTTRLSLSGATAEMEYSVDDGATWHPVSPELADGTRTLDVSAPATKLHIRKAATSQTLASEMAKLYPDTWKKADFSLGEPMYFFGSAYLNGMLYVAGGRNLFVQEHLNTLRAYDLHTGTVSPKANLPGGRFGMPLLNLNGKLYGIGGYSTSNEKSVLEYDPVEDEWVAKNDLPIDTGISFAAPVAVDGTAYLLGGMSSIAISSEVYQYDADHDSWQKKSKPYGPSRIYAAYASAGGKIYVFGGRETNTMLDNVVQYDPATESTTEISEFNETANWSKRLGSAAVALPDGKIMVIGGATLGDYDGITGEVSIYDPAANSWQEVEKLLIPRVHAGAIITENNEVYVFGGVISSSGFGTDSVEKFQYVPEGQPLPSSDASLTSIALSGLTLTAPVSAGVYDYMTEATTASETTVHTVTGSVYATVAMKLNGMPAVNPLQLEMGENTISLEVTAQDGSVQLYTVTVERRNPPTDGNNGNNGGSSGGSNGGGGSADKEDSPGPATVDVYVDGVKQIGLASATKEQTNGRETMIVTLDHAKVLPKVERGESKVVTIPVTGDPEAVVGQLNGSLLRAMAANAVRIELVTDRAVYSLPASLLDLDEIAASLGAEGRADDVQIAIRIAPADEAAVARIAEGARQTGGSVLIEPVDFGLSASYGGKVVEMNRFSEYVQRFIAVPGEIDVSRITTGVVLGDNGALIHAPTKVTLRDGKPYAEINSLTNGTYAVIWNPKTFADVEKHWSRDEVNDMAGRLIVNGMNASTFSPDRHVTRAEFTAIAVRALGLRPEPATSDHWAWSDVDTSDWFAGELNAAMSYGLIRGYEDGTFRPDRTISRSEAAAIVARATKIVRPQADSATPESDGAWLEAFADGDEVASWAVEEIAAAIRTGILQGHNGMIRPADPTTRAQAAAMFRRWLQSAELIDNIR